jgi:hypothetical protein
MFIPSTITVSDGAYGRRYATVEEAVAAWEAGKDFLNRSMTPGTYINKEDALRYAPDADIKIRLDHDATFVLLTRSGDGYALYRQALEADAMLCKLLAEMHLPAES